MAETFPVDLQLHSTASDGTDSPAALVAYAAELGVRALALTDHDSVLGVDEALQAGREQGVYVLPALEFSTRHEPERDLEDINILAYGIDHHDSQLTGVLQQVIESRIEQKIRQIERLQSYGIHVPVDEVLASAAGVPGRVHIAQVALAHNPARFASIRDVFDQYLTTDAPNSTFVPRNFNLTVENAIDVAHSAGGIAVLAHPGSYVRVQDIDGVVRRLCAEGLDGIEVRYTYAQNRGHFGASSAQVAAIMERFARLAQETGLLVTGGSDYHGRTKPGIIPGQAGLTWDEWMKLAPTYGWEV